MSPSRLFIALLSYLAASIAEASDPVVVPKFPWIRKFASIGDSYAAGLGAGKRIDFGCSRYGHSHPNLLQTHYLGHDPNRTHDFFACSGATANDIRTLQVPQLGTNLDLLTISAGGNDIGLTPILNDCVYQFYFADDKACQKSITNAQRKIADESELFDKILRLIAAAAPKMNQTHGLIYVTGYAGFFGTDDNICDNVTWSVWRDVESEKQFLKLETRQKLNDMVRSVNLVLRNATEIAGPQVRFIDYDAYIEEAKGRYCEAGVIEPDPNRLGLAFYEWDTIDQYDNATQLKRTGDDVPRGSFEGNIAEMINKTLQEHPDWEFDPSKGYVNKSKMVVRPEGLIDDTIWWLLPDTWKRVFHLRPEAHAIIAQLIVEDLEGKEKLKKESVILLLQLAGVGGALIVMLVVLLAMCRRKGVKTNEGYTAVAAADASDDETLADEEEQRGIATTKGYNTFG